MPTKCAIRFTDEERSRSVTVSRDRHGEPDQVLLNLVELEEFTKAMGTHGSPHQAAAQFLFLDTLWYVRYHYDPDEFGEVLWEMLSNPNMVPNEFAEILSIHKLGNFDSDDEGVFYELKIPRGAKWRISFRNVGGSDSYPFQPEYEGRLWEVVKNFLEGR